MRRSLIIEDDHDANQLLADLVLRFQFEPIQASLETELRRDEPGPGRGNSEELVHANQGSGNGGEEEPDLAAIYVVEKTRCIKEGNKARKTE